MQKRLCELNDVIPFCGSRSVDELQNEGVEKTTYSKGSSNYSDGEPVASPETSGTQKVNGHYFNAPEKNKDMESALLHQAQLICRYEEEEKAQREWEEKFRENNSATQVCFLSFGRVHFFVWGYFGLYTYQFAVITGSTSMPVWVQYLTGRFIDPEP